MKIPLDKQAHFFAGMAIAFTIALFTLSPFAGLITAIVAGVLKEVYDKYTKRGTPDHLDAIATGLGGVVVYLMYAAIKIFSGN
jgi:hypothetical protein